MYILGLSCFYHDSAAALIFNGEIIAAAQEERFTRTKNDKTFPAYSIAYCLDEAGISMGDVSIIAFYEDTAISVPRLVKTMGWNLMSLPKIAFRIDEWARYRLRVEAIVGSRYPDFRGSFEVCGHHRSHAAAAFYPSPYEESAILTIDGVGDDLTASIAQGKGNEIEVLECMRFPSSVGLFYSAMTTFLGFKANSGEYKVMGLAPYGDWKRFYSKIRRCLINVDSNGELRIGSRYFSFRSDSSMYTKELVGVLGVAPREPDEPINKDHMDIAAAMQRVTEDIVETFAIKAKEVTGCTNLCMAGGVALNCVSNGKLQRKQIFNKIWVQPASGDSGSAIGCALDSFYRSSSLERKVLPEDSMKNSYLGPRYTDEEVHEFLNSVGAVFRVFEAEDELIQEVTRDIINGDVVGVFRDRMEFGPRALGSRSIIGDPRRQDTQTKMNLKIKFRESFRPFAPFVMKEHIDEWFEDVKEENKYMLFVAMLKESKRKIFNDDKDKPILERLSVQRSEVPAVTHLDYSARVQVVSEESNPFIHRLLMSFYRFTGVPILVNTSFNVRGEPIVCTPADAYQGLIMTNMDKLIIGKYYLARADQALPDEKVEELYEQRRLID